MSNKTEPVMPDLWEHERLAWSEGRLLVAGIDEAGRGPLAGPVVAAAVILPQTGFDAQGITDSKKLSPQARERLFERLCADESVCIGIGIVDAPDIDRLNILRATHHAMRRALAALSSSVDAVLVDGLPVPDLHADSRALVKGDSRSFSIAAASIIAKVTRDRLMCGEYHDLYPEYNFARHKGYPSPEHLAALEAHGPCAIHRRSFGPVAQKCLRF
ncbi:MAG: ribonuclease HII [Armatimonadota bacterium]